MKEIGGNCLRDCGVLTVLGWWNWRGWVVGWGCVPSCIVWIMERNVVWNWFYLCNHFVALFDGFVEIVFYVLQGGEGRQLHSVDG